MCLPRFGNEKNGTVPEDVGAIFGQALVIEERAAKNFELRGGTDYAGASTVMVCSIGDMLILLRQGCAVELSCLCVSESILVRRK